jgi:hypothetical protein
MGTDVANKSDDMSDIGMDDLVPSCPKCGEKCSKCMDMLDMTGGKMYGKSALQQMGRAKSLEARIEPMSDDPNDPHGSFRLILSKDNTDRDDENLWADEWMHPLPPKIHMDSDHAWARHMSVPLTVGSGVPSISESGDLVVAGTYARTKHAQDTRQLVNDGHVWQASVSYMDHLLPDGRVVRELLNGTFTGVPANPEAVILASKGMDPVAAPDREKAHGFIGADQKAGGKPYGNVRYADPGYQPDKKARYPIDTEEHVRAALSYFGQEKNRAKYSAEQASAILGRIHSAARRLGIDVSSDKSVANLLEGCAMLIKMKDFLAPPTQTTPGHTESDEDIGASSVYDTDPDGDGDTDGDNDEDAEDDNTLEWGDVHQSLAQACHDMACNIRDAALALGAQAEAQTENKDAAFDGAPEDWFSGKALEAVKTGGYHVVVAGPDDAQKFYLQQGQKILAKGPVKDFPVTVVHAKGAPIGPYQGVEGMSGENASGTTPGESIVDGDLFLKGTAGPAIQPESKSLPPSTGEKDAAASDKDAAASVSPADVAARARLRKFQLDTALLESEAI